MTDMMATCWGGRSRGRKGTEATDRLDGMLWYKDADTCGFGGSFGGDCASQAMTSPKMRDVYPEGTHFIIPWFERPTIYDVFFRSNLVECTPPSKDLQMVDEMSISPT